MIDVVKLQCHQGLGQAGGCCLGPPFTLSLLMALDVC